MKLDTVFLNNEFKKYEDTNEQIEAVLTTGFDKIFKFCNIVQYDHHATIYGDSKIVGYIDQCDRAGVKCSTVHFNVKETINYEPVYLTEGSFTLKNIHDLRRVAKKFLKDREKLNLTREAAYIQNKYEQMDDLARVIKELPEEKDVWFTGYSVCKLMDITKLQTELCMKFWNREDIVKRIEKFKRENAFLYKTN